MKSRIDWIRRGARVIRMVGELHRMGYQRLRIFPYLYPLAWRVGIGPADWFSPRNGALIEEGTRHPPTYSSASQNEYFGWTDARTDDARQLANKFVERFPDIAAAGVGRDWAYVGWLVELLHELERQPQRLPAVQWEYGPDPLTLTELPMPEFGDSTSCHGSFVLPPPPMSRGADDLAGKRPAP